MVREPLYGAEQAEVRAWQNERKSHSPMLIPAKVNWCDVPPDGGVAAGPGGKAFVPRSVQCRRAGRRT